MKTELAEARAHDEKLQGELLDAREKTPEECEKLKRACEDELFHGVKFLRSSDVNICDKYQECANEEGNML